MSGFGLAALLAVNNVLWFLFFKRMSADWLDCVKELSEKLDKQ